MLDGKISILIVDTATDFGGSIVSTANLIRGLDRARFEPIFVSATTEDLLRNKLLESSKQTKVFIVRKIFHYGVIGRISAAFKKIPIAPLRKALIYSLYPLRFVLNLPYMFRLARIIRSQRVDLVQFNNAFGNDELDIVCILLRIPRVVYFRGYIPLSAIERRFFLKGIKGFLAVSEFVKAQAIADGVSEEKIVVATPPAIVDPIDDATRNNVLDKYGIRREQPVFGIFGRVVQWKGQKQFVEAAALVFKSFPDSWAVIVGDTSDGGAGYLNEVKALAKKLAIDERVIFTGYIERVYELYRIMDVVVHASVEPEPSGRVIFEAMSCGVPVIASCLGGPKEFIVDGVDGFICDPNRPEQIADRVCRLLGDSRLRAQMGERAENKVAELYNKTAYAALVSSLYLEALNLPSGA